VTVLSLVACKAEITADTDPLISDTADTAGDVAAPEAAEVEIATDEKTAIAVDVLASAEDPADLPLEVEALDDLGTAGTVSLDVQTQLVTYDPDGQFDFLGDGESALDTFWFTVSNGKRTATAPVSVTITGINDPPVLVPVGDQSSSVGDLI